MLGYHRAMGEAEQAAAAAITEQIHRMADAALKLPESERDAYLAAAARATAESLRENGLSEDAAAQFGSQLEQLARNLIALIVRSGGSQGGRA